MACKLTSTPGQQSRTEVPSCPALTVQLTAPAGSCRQPWCLVYPGGVQMCTSACVPQRSQSPPMPDRRLLQEAAKGPASTSLATEASQRGNGRAWDKAPSTTPTRKKPDDRKSNHTDLPAKAFEVSLRKEAMHWGFPGVRELCRHVGMDSGLVNTLRSVFLSLSDPYSLAHTHAPAHTHPRPPTHTHTQLPVHTSSMSCSWPWSVGPWVST